MARESGDHHLVKRAVEAPVAAAVEPKAGDLPNAGRQRTGSGKSGERCLGSDPPGVRPTHPQLRRHDRPDAGLGQQLRNVRGGEGLQVGLDGLRVAGEGSNATRQPPE
jgi:hypothetical protein